MTRIATTSEVRTEKCGTCPEPVGQAPGPDPAPRSLGGTRLLRRGASLLPSFLPTHRRLLLSAALIPG